MQPLPIPVWRYQIKPRFHRERSAASWILGLWRADRWQLLLRVSSLRRYSHMHRGDGVAKRVDGGAQIVG